MLVRRKHLFFAFCARRGLRYWVYGLTILAPEAGSAARSKIGSALVSFDLRQKEPLGTLVRAIPECNLFCSCRVQELDSGRDL